MCSACNLRLADGMAVTIKKDTMGNVSRQAEPMCTPCGQSHVETAPDGMEAMMDLPHPRGRGRLYSRRTGPDKPIPPTSGMVS